MILAQKSRTAISLGVLILITICWDQSEAGKEGSSDNNTTGKDKRKSSKIYFVEKL